MRATSRERFIQSLLYAVQRYVYFTYNEMFSIQCIRRRILRLDFEKAEARRIASRIPGHGGNGYGRDNPIRADHLVRFSRSKSPRRA